MTITSSVDMSRIPKGHVWSSWYKEYLFTAIQGEVMGIGTTASEAINNCLSAIEEHAEGHTLVGYVQQDGSTEVCRLTRKKLFGSEAKGVATKETIYGKCVICGSDLYPHACEFGTAYGPGATIKVEKTKRLKVKHI